MSTNHHVLQGDLKVCFAEGDVLNALLGSCVAACLRDPVLRIGGMNHFLLPGDNPGTASNVRYGAHAMERLINGLMREGAHRDRLEVYLFGGANVMKSLPKIGAANCEFARRFVRDEGLRLVHEDLGGNRGRRIKFVPSSGVFDVAMMVMDEDQPPPGTPPYRAPPSAPDLDLW